MKKILLVGINAKYIHTNLAIRSLKAYADEQSQETLCIDICEFTINQATELIFREIIKKEADIIGFSCYIWNYELVSRLVRELKKVLPDVVIFLGGPEVSFDADAVLKNTDADFVICGEGEHSFFEAAKGLTSGGDIVNIQGLAYRCGETIIQNEPMPPLCMDDIPFPYKDFSDFDNRIAYYEASRGCPFNCQYCLSGAAGGVRLRSIEKVKAELSLLLKAGLRQVKLVDRTFNCNKEYAMAIWQYLAEHDNGITNFHFEITAELLDEDMLDFLINVRRGLFQFEIGVQSTNEPTLKAIKRTTLTHKLTPIIAKLHEHGNIHLHLDLIAGLPFENYQAFKRSFNYIYSLAPEMLQLGFLKVLKGSGLHTAQVEYGLVHTDYPPYEVIKTNWLSVKELLRLKLIEEMVEQYYNSHRYVRCTETLLCHFVTPFDMFEQLSIFYEDNKLHTAPLSKLYSYTVLYDFACNIGADIEEFKLAALLDIYSHEKAKKLPSWLNSSHLAQYKNKIYDFYDNRNNIDTYLPEYIDFDTKQIFRSAHIEVLPNGKALLFNYLRRDMLLNAVTTEIEL